MHKQYILEVYQHFKWNNGDEVNKKTLHKHKLIFSVWLFLSSEGRYEIEDVLNTCDLSPVYSL